MSTIKIKQHNAVYAKIICESSTAQELSEHLTFVVDGYKFMPAYKSGRWDGRIRLFNPFTCLVYAGLVGDIVKFAKDRDYDVELDDAFAHYELSVKEFFEFIEGLGLPAEKSPRDYQVKSVIQSLRETRAMLVSPTASGKSLIIYMIFKYLGLKTLLVVPTTHLVNQMATDFEEYGYTDGSHRIYSGKEKETDFPITISTWQSIYKMPKAWFNKYDVIIVDEAHLADAKSLTGIMEKCEKIRWRFGLTGTLKGTKINELVLKGLFGKVVQVTTTAELQKRKFLAELKIKVITLKYADETRRIVSGYKYEDELDFIVTNRHRNRFLRNLLISLEGNTILLYQFVEKHGIILYDMVKAVAGERPVFLVHGGTKPEDRERIRKEFDASVNGILIASAVFSTGVNIINVHNVVFSSPSKSRIRNLQQIGRVLRKMGLKTSATLYDIADDLSWKSKRNYTLNHMMERLKIYDEQEFDYKIYNVRLKDG
jgi:superfamily II DNA or RNA helicase